MADITMPQLGETVTEGTITKWFKQVGDQVAEDEVLFEVSTDKVDSEVPSPRGGRADRDPRAGGRDRRRRHPAGRDRRWRRGRARRSREPRRRRGARTPGTGADAEPAPAEAEPAEAEPARRRPRPTPAEPPSARPSPSPAAPSTATEPAAGSPPAGGDGEGDLVLSPVVRKLLKEHDLEPGQIEGTGQGGRITRADVLAYIDKGGAASGLAAPAPAPACTRPCAGSPCPRPRRRPRPHPRPHRRRRLHPRRHRRPRRAPAPRRLRVARPGPTTRRPVHQHPAAHGRAHGALEGDVGPRAHRHRGRLRGRRPGAPGRARRVQGPRGLQPHLPARSSPGAVVDALREFPKLNASVGDDALIVHHRIHLGIAVDLNFEGLLVPVIRDAEDMRLPAIAREISDLAARARSKQLGADDISGGTFTITNPGPVRHVHHRARHQPAPGGDPLHRRREEAGRSPSSCPTAPTPSPSTRSGCSRSRSTTGPTTAPTPRRSSPSARRSSRPATGRQEL